MKLTNTAYVAGGVAVAVGWVVDIDGEKEWEVTFGGDCRGSSESGGSVEIELGGGTLTIPLQFGASQITVSQSFDKLFKIAVDKSSPEGGNLNIQKHVIVRGNGKIIEPLIGGYTIDVIPVKGEPAIPAIRWKNSKVKEDHFSPLPCAQR
jgi:hypothetical protein